MFSIRKSFATKLSLTILLLVIPIFLISLGALFIQSRYIIRKEAIGRANSMLSTTMQRVYRNLATLKTATDTNSKFVSKYQNPDSLLSLSNRIVRLNPHIDGCSISAEPDLFPQFGGNFSVYSVRMAKMVEFDKQIPNGGDTIISVVEAKYNYFSKVWYKTPQVLGKPCWVVYYDEGDTLEITLDGMLATYCKPLYKDNGKFIGVISSDLSLLRLSNVISKEKPYPNSYFMMIDGEGHYIVHPDSTLLFSQSIFSNADPKSQADLIALGHEMTKGNEGNMTVVIDGAPCLVCYQPVPDTSWSLAIVCPDSDVLAGYHKQVYILIPLLVIGVFFILLLCQRGVGHAIRPLNQLLEKTQSIAAGNMEVHIPTSQREDVVGRLQNSFATMLRSLNFHMGVVRYTTEQAMQRNEELAQATRMVMEADHQKTAFIQDVSHQIRTPLNIIMGFAQILNSYPKQDKDGVEEGLSEEEMKSIAYTMEYHSNLLNRMVLMLFDSSETGQNEERNCRKEDFVSCNEVSHEVIDSIKIYYPNVNISFETNVDDDFRIKTNSLFLMRSIREMLYNSAKYSDGKHIVLRVDVTDTTIRFIVEDTGKGIAEADRDVIFQFFSKVDNLSEGLGLGLPLSKRHAHTLGGDLMLDEDYHDGCRIIFELPRAST